MLGRNCLVDGFLDPVVFFPTVQGVMQMARPMALDVDGDGVDELLILTPVGNDATRLDVYGPERVPSRPCAREPRNLTNFNLYGGFLR